MAKLFITISDVKRIIFLIHKRTILKLQLKAYDYTKEEHKSKIIILEVLLNFIEAELKRFHDDDIQHIDKSLMEGYTEKEISSMYRYYISKQKRKLNRWNK